MELKQTFPHPIRMIEGQPFAGEFIGTGIHYHTCIGYYDNLHLYPNYGTRECPACNSVHTDLTEREGGRFELLGYCHICKLVWDSHNLKCDCENRVFEQDGGKVKCANCGLEANSIQDLLYKLVG